MIQNLQLFLKDGHLTAWFTLLAGVLLILVSTERLMYLYVSVKRVSEDTLRNLHQMILRRQYTEALQICNASQSSPEFKVIKSGLLSLDSGREAMKSSVGAAVVEVSKSCEKRVPIIAMIASVSTLLGLLGTISGMKVTFNGLAEASPAQKAALLGNGIAEAMNSTAAGLIVGIAALVLHTLCTVKIDEIVANAQKTGYDIVSLLEKSERS